MRMPRRGDSVTLSRRRRPNMQSPPRIHALLSILTGLALAATITFYVVIAFQGV
jgi:hypothetical protein